MTGSNILTLPEAPWERFTRWGVTLGQACISKPARSAAKHFAAHSCKESDRAFRLDSLMAAANRVVLKHQVRQMVGVIRDLAKSQEWSQRETEKQTGFSHRTLARLARAQGKLELWLPKLRAAVARLNPQPATKP